MREPSFASALATQLAMCGNPGAAPEQLAELFRWTFGRSPEAGALRWGLQTELLRWTLEEARARTKYYAREGYLASPRCELGAAPDLTAFPVVRRRDVAENLTAMHAEGVTFGSVSHTSGCTGAALSVYRSAEELAFLWRYQARLLSPVRASLPRRPLVLSLPNFYHGASVPVPSLGKVFVGGVTDDLLIGDLVKLLRQRFQIPGHDERISMISCLAHQMLFLTSYLLEQGIDPKEFGIRSINLVGGYVPRSRRAYLREVWGALVIDRFSLTESVGGATRCLDCGRFHLDPHVLGEVLDDSARLVEEGVGRLVLTQLYPFVQMQPFVRYDTGDLVQRIASDCQSSLTFEFAGKAANCIGVVRNGVKEWLILSVPLNEVLDSIPDFTRLEQFRSVQTARDASVGSLPLYTLASQESRPGVTRINLTLELRYPPGFYPERTAELAQHIRRELAERHPVLAARLADGSVELGVAFVGPGALGTAGIMKI